MLLYNNATETDFQFLQQDQNRDTNLDGLSADIHTQDHH